MRTIALLICASVLFPSVACAGLAQEDISRVISGLDLERTRSEAHAKCVHDVPAAIEWLRDPVFEQYCVVRHGAPRKIGLFLGVRLSLELEQAGKAAQSSVVDALVDVQEATDELPARP
jgi:hypothetical protein